MRFQVYAIMFFYIQVCAYESVTIPRWTSCQIKFGPFDSNECCV